MKKWTQYPLALACLAAIATSATAQQPATAAASLTSVLEDAAQSEKYTFVLFYRDNSQATQRMLQTVRQSVGKRADRAVIATANVNDPAEQAQIEHFGVSRAPMPLTVAVAPNGAVTGVYPRTVTDERIATAFVAPVMMRCMKELQNEKLVFVCLTKTDAAAVPQGVRQLQMDPQFKDRISLVGLQAGDPAEQKLIGQLKLQSVNTDDPYAALVAPPGVLIGHFDAKATADQIAAAIHKAGQC
ncbi:MAG: hypothetical protein ACIALR_14775, partial [Blastopirellula sp. JB062]